MGLCGIVFESFHRSPRWFRLLMRWQGEAAILLTDSRSAKVRHQNQFQEEEELSRAGRNATSETLTADPCTRKDAIRCP